MWSSLFLTTHQEKRDGAVVEKDSQSGVRLRVAGGGCTQTCLMSKRDEILQSSCQVLAQVENFPDEMV